MWVGRGGGGRRFVRGPRLERSPFPLAVCGPPPPLEGGGPGHRGRHWEMFGRKGRGSREPLSAVESNRGSRFPGGIGGGGGGGGNICLFRRHRGQVRIGTRVLLLVRVGHVPSFSDQQGSIMYACGFHWMGLRCCGCTLDRHVCLVEPHPARLESPCFGFPLIGARTDGLCGFWGAGLANSGGRRPPPVAERWDWWVGLVWFRVVPKKNSLPRRA